MSVLRRIWESFSSSRYLVGRDLEGNCFYEYPSVSDDIRRTKRIVKYKHGQDMLDYASGGRRLPVQWSSWLTHTRPHPPTLEELHADLERQKRVLLNAALIAARDREDSGPKHVTAAQQDVAKLAAGASQASGDSSVIRPSPTVRDTGQSMKPSDEPEPWQPRTTRRGGN
ncbi:hypothetical protein AcV5_002524 [Taiwanofungus camphoratus]|nr:hypothetical protein AcV5_002524 [Antrodia cinnamomea]KAI0942111.1 hypothetical protein AcV7_002633 [Antrodia cinnamomea]